MAIGKSGSRGMRSIAFFLLAFFLLLPLTPLLATPGDFASCRMACWRVKQCCCKGSSTSNWLYSSSGKSVLRASSCPRGCWQFLPGSSASHVIALIEVRVAAPPSSDSSPFHAHLCFRYQPAIFIWLHQRPPPAAG